MFFANSKLTGLKFTYDGNPHTFGSRHPSYVNYREDGIRDPQVCCPDAPPLPAGELLHALFLQDEDVKDGVTTTVEAACLQQSVAFPSDFAFNLPRIWSALDETLTLKN